MKNKDQSNLNYFIHKYKEMRYEIDVWVLYLFVIIIIIIFLQGIA